MCGCSENNNIYGADGVGISSIVDLNNNSFKVILTNGTEYTIKVYPAKGETGSTGATGPIGPTGLPGNPGADGTNGTNGINGLNGRTVWSGVGVPNDILGIQDDHYIDITTWDFYKKGETSWGSPIGNIRGGEGVAGADGVIGNIIIFSADLASAPTVDNISGDTLITTDNYNIYNWDGDSWNIQGNLKGTTGATGARGRSQAVYIQSTEPTGGSYYDGDIWIVDDAVVPPPEVTPPVISYNRAMNMVVVVEDEYDIIPVNNGVITFTIDTALPNDLVFIAKIKYLSFEEEQTITITANIIAGQTSIAVAFNTGDDGGLGGEAPYTSNQPTNVCLDSYLSLADVTISNLDTFQCLV